MLTSIGVPSQEGDVLRGASLPHSRTSSEATVQVTPSASVIVAWAAGATSSDPAITETSSTSFRMSLSSFVPRCVPRRTGATP